MAHERLRLRIASQLKEMRNGDYIREMVNTASKVIESNAPSESGRLIRNLRTQTPLDETENGFTKGLGDKNFVGKEGQSPRGTITAFLRDFKQFRGGSFSPRGPWWGLSREGKEELQRQRESGNYGGLNASGSDKSPYFYQQEGTFWGEGAVRAGIRPTYFVQDSLAQWRTSILPSIINRFKVRFKSAA